MPHRSRDWFSQAEVDLEHAVEAAAAGRHEWSCFAAHQAAEKAVKALHLRHGQEAWGHVVARLLRELPEEVSAELVEQAKVLDGYYIPTRDPNGHPAGAPHEHYGRLHSEGAVTHARALIEFVRTRLAQ